MRNQSGVSLQISLQSTGDRLINLDRKFSVSNCTRCPHLSGFNNISFQQLLVCTQHAAVWAFRIVLSRDIAKEQRGCFNQSGSNVLIGTQICKYAYSMYMIKHLELFGAFDSYTRVELDGIKDTIDGEVYYFKYMQI